MFFRVSILGLILNLTIVMLSCSLVSLSFYNLSFSPEEDGARAVSWGLLRRLFSFLMRPKGDVKSGASSTSSSEFKDVYDHVNKTALTNFLLNERLSTAGTYIRFFACSLEHFVACRFLLQTISYKISLKSGILVDNGATD